MIAFYGCVIVAIGLVHCVAGNDKQSFVESFIKCHLCETIEMNGQISECNCDFHAVHESVNNFFAPVLWDITQRNYFQYFRVDLNRECPFWNEERLCMNEGCSVHQCTEEEIPRPWIDEIRQYEIDTRQEEVVELANCNNSLGKVNFVSPYDTEGNYQQFLRDTEDDEGDWTDMEEDKVFSLSGQAARAGTYVNLLQNPERFTGYKGEAAHRVWRSIQEENCFGGMNDVCLEKRLFHRLMRGLQGSISTHIAREYFYADDSPAGGHWDVNVPHFVRTVGAHTDRVNNLHFAFLFMLRAVMKAGDLLVEYPYDTGNKSDDAMLRSLMQKFVQSNQARTGRLSMVTDLQLQTNTSRLDNDDLSVIDIDKNVDECRNGFDESALFQVPEPLSPLSGQYWDHKAEKEMLLEEFRLRFRNITRIMDCVSCEKCRVWGKLQFLGVGTAIKVLLSSPEELSAGSKLLNRQEVIALVNTLHQVTRSVLFASRAPDLEVRTKLQDFQIGMTSILTVLSVIGAVIAGMYLLSKSLRKNNNHDKMKE